jgi:hypothetical protein
MGPRRGFPVQSVSPKVRILGGTVTIGSSGAISDQSGAKLSGGTVTQTGSEDGRYHVAFDRSYMHILGAHCQMVGPDDSAFPTTTGSDPQTRNLDVDGFDIQAKRVDTQADADSASGTVYSWFAIVALM